MRDTAVGSIEDTDADALLVIFRRNRPNECMTCHGALSDVAVWQLLEINGNRRILATCARCMSNVVSQSKIDLAMGDGVVLRITEAVENIACPSETETGAVLPRGN